MAKLETISIRTSAREELVDITALVQDVVRATGVRSGMAWICSPHTTAAITVQENADPDVQSDLLDHLRRMVPQRPDFRHGEGNADAHIKTSLVGASQGIPVEEGRLQLGTWQAIFFCEFDGPRSRRVVVRVLADATSPE
jgi:secondary thiamine-phosphate synthase enzyme